MGFFAMQESAVLLQALQQRDTEALTRVYDSYASAIFKYAYHHCENVILADQVVGDVFAKLLEKLSQGCGPDSNLRSYLFEIAHHLIVDEVRYSRRLTSMSALEFSLPAATYTDLAVEDRLLLDVVLGAIRNILTDHQRHVIILRFMEGFSIKETALIMGKSIGNIKITQNRAVAAIRKAIDAQRVGLPAD
jgi:RNA polymerase sigma-70 factor, ECF subfamily